MKKPTCETCANYRPKDAPAELIRCSECASFVTKTQGLYKAVGCGNEESPLHNKWTSDEVEMEKFKAFACPLGRKRG